MFETKQIYAWTDSTIVLAWIRSHPNKWKTFVSNRISEIHDTLKPEVWRHVGTKDNPADGATRGIEPSNLINHHLWWTGPVWLTHQEQDWPILKNSKLIDTPLEKRKIVALFTKTSDFHYRILDHCSSFTKLLRVTAYCYKFILGCTTKTPCLTTFHLNKAHLFWLLYLQTIEFSTELLALKKKTSLPSNSRILNLNPFIDEDGLIRVGGRLKNAQMPDDMKHPIIVSSSHLITRMIIDHAHKITIHGGVN